jgi:hypothetical protein
MKIVAKNIIAVIKSKKAARDERLQRQAAADAYLLATAHDHRRSQR